MRILFLLLSVALSLGVTPATAGALISATISSSIFGGVVVLNGTGVGSLDTGSGAFTYDANGAFSGLFSEPALATSMGGSVTTATGQVTITKVTISFGSGPNGLAGNTGTTGSVTGAGLTGVGGAFGNVLALAQVGIPLAAVLVSYGGGASFVQPAFKVTGFSGAITIATISISQVAGDFWHLGTVGATGLTTTTLSSMGSMSMSSTGGTAMANGAVSVTGSGNTVITLVTLAKTTLLITTGIGTTMSTTASPVFLTLTYVPEPGTLLLLGSGALGLFALRRRYKR